MNLLEKYKALVQEAKKSPPSIEFYNTILFKKKVPSSMVNLTPFTKSQPSANVKAVWPPEAQTRIDWFMTLNPPTEPFYLAPYIHVIDTEKFFASLKREIESGPGCPRGRNGALLCDLETLRKILH